MGTHLERHGVVGEGVGGGVACAIYNATINSAQKQPRHINHDLKHRNCAEPNAPQTKQTEKETNKANGTNKTKHNIDTSISALHLRFAKAEGTQINRT